MPAGSTPALETSLFLVKSANPALQLQYCSDDRVFKRCQQQHKILIAASRRLIKMPRGLRPKNHHCSPAPGPGADPGEGGPFPRSACAVPRKQRGRGRGRGRQEGAMLRVLRTGPAPRLLQQQQQQRRRRRQVTGGGHFVRGGGPGEAREPLRRRRGDVACQGPAKPL